MPSCWSARPAIRAWVRVRWPNPRPRRSAFPCDTRRTALSRTINLRCGPDMRILAVWIRWPCLEPVGSQAVRVSSVHAGCVQPAAEPRRYRGRYPPPRYPSSRAAELVWLGANQAPRRYRLRPEDAGSARRLHLQPTVPTIEPRLRRSLSFTRQLTQPICRYPAANTAGSPTSWRIVCVNRRVDACGQPIREPRG